MTGRILLVDENPDRAVAMCARLVSAYFEVTEARSVAEAMALLKVDPPDIVLVQADMSGPGGFDLCERTKADALTAHLPVVIMLRGTGDEERLRGLRAGADDVVSPGVIDVALLARMRSLMRSKLMVDELRAREQTSRALGLPSSGLDRINSESLRPRDVLLLPPPGRDGMIWRHALSDLIGAEPRFTSGDPGALDLALETPPDLVIVHRRPIGAEDGLRIIARIRALPATRSAAAMIVLDEPDGALAALGLELGADDYLAHPASPAELAIRARMLLRRRAYSDRLSRSLTNGLKMAVTDPLTGLGNRRFLVEHLERQLTRGNSTGLMILDLDRFKTVNDENGHVAGDAVLRDFAERLKSCIRASDFAARIGGEEFCVALKDVDRDLALDTAERIRAASDRAPFVLPGGGELSVTVSVGVAMAEANMGPEALLAKADGALYAAKNSGRNAVRAA